LLPSFRKRRGPNESYRIPSLKSGNCNHRRYVPELIQLVRTGALCPSSILTQTVAFDSAIAAYRAFDRREPGWTKVELIPTTSGRAPVSHPVVTGHA
jgi:hypothetical protein